jgi:hypothetical protein
MGIYIDATVMKKNKKVLHEYIDMLKGKVCYYLKYILNVQRVNWKSPVWFGKPATMTT